VAASLFVEVLPHVILAAEIPATREVVEFLETIHVVQNFEVGAANIEINVPIAAFLESLDAVEFECVDDALVL
jgi:hypothetical protein